MRTAFAPDRILEVRTRWEFDGAPADFGRLSDVVVVDCRAASTRIFLNYFDETEMPTVLEGINAGLSCWNELTSRSNASPAVPEPQSYTMRRGSLLGLQWISPESKQTWPTAWNLVLANGMASRLVYQITAKLREQPDGRLLDKLVSGVGVGAHRCW